MENLSKKLLLFLILFLFSGYLFSEKNDLIIQSTTSTRDSGLYKYLMPIFSKKFNVDVSVVAVGTGQALSNAKNCDADILIVHARDLEEKFVKDGFGSMRSNLMYNKFIIIGPKTDPANISTEKNIHDVFLKIMRSNSKFISRSDDSGTYFSEMKIWNDLNLNPKIYSGNWYLESGQGMGATLNIAIGINAYTFTDSSTWIRFKNKSSHTILFESNETAMYNQYGVIKINPKHCPGLNHMDAGNLYDWLLSKEGQNLINGYKLHGKQLFYAN
ncbi:MAG: substrate-binding domain-containing protein [Pseudomonadota bacterium]|nr:substrate-binding domain-containing protein [Pseudomonadota bacterium]